MHNPVQVVMETPRISANDRVIYKDKLPKSLYEYYVNGYSEKDILTLAQNMRISFDNWEKTFNQYRTSNEILSLSGDDMAILFEDIAGNGFIYSFLTNKIYYYNAQIPPHINPKEAMSIADFRAFCQRDFDALLRTPYGKKYITTEAVVTEGLKEFFGFGQALRIYIDGRGAGKETDRFAFDKHSYAFLDAMIRFSKKLMTKQEYEAMLGRPNTIVEIYKNRKLGRRNNFRNMIVRSSALEDTETMSLRAAMEKYGLQPDKLYEKYLMGKAVQLALEAAKPLIEKYMKQNPALKDALVEEPDSEFDSFICDPYMAGINFADHPVHNIIAVCRFELSDFARAMIGMSKNRLDRFSNQDILTKFEFHCTKIRDIIKSCDKSKILAVTFEFENSRDFMCEDLLGECEVGIVYSKGNIRSEFTYAPSISQVDAMESMEVSPDFFQYMTGHSLESFITKRDLCKYVTLENYDLEEVLDEIPETTDEELLEMAQHITPELIANTMILVEEDRSMVRKTAHAIKSGIDKVSQTAGNIARKAKEMAAPIMQKIRQVIDGSKKRTEQESREIVITDSEFLKLKRFFRTCIVVPVIAGTIVSPAFGIVAFLVQCARKTKDEKMRSQIVLELETELKLTREKIEDAKSESDKKAKYELMRLESRLEEELARIKYGTSQK